MKYYLQSKEGNLKRIKSGLPSLFVETRNSLRKIIIAKTNLTISVIFLHLSFAYNKLFYHFTIYRVNPLVTSIK